MVQYDSLDSQGSPLFPPKSLLDMVSNLTIFKQAIHHKSLSPRLETVKCGEVFGMIQYDSLDSQGSPLFPPKSLLDMVSNLTIFKQAIHHKSLSPRLETGKCLSWLMLFNCPAFHTYIL
ncbi:hypothetical protein AHF37_04661 [Paragonimus kellicotti]|nr:hypothetical protein AHF37_04661 [Paragonimus kellicotti]